MSNVKPQSSEAEFTGWRARFWPIHNYEMKKFVPMGMIMFFLLFNYTVLRDTKDTLVVNSAGAGAISFLKLYCVTPAAVLFVIIYAKLSNIFNRENLFYVTVTPFVVFFGIFGFLLYPNLDLFHPAADKIAALHAQYPRFSGFIDLYAYWAYSAFYVASEIWGSAMIALLFWQFANQVTRTHEAKRFYGLFVVLGNVALIFSGQVVNFCSSTIKHFYPEGTTEAVLWGVSLKLLMAAVVIAGIGAMAIYRWMHRHVLTDIRFYDPSEQAPKKKKEKPSLVESAKLIFSSPELGLIAILIMAYGVTINLVEVQWKQQLKLFYEGDRGGYNAFMGNYSTVTGIVTILFSLFFGANILRKVSWFKAAIITPGLILSGGVLFFLFILARDMMEGFLHAMATNAVTAATFLGALIVIFSKAVKYALFDPTKEMAYIPLDDELKVKGKAAVDVIGGRAGKAGGAAVQSVLLMLYATKDVIAIAPIAFITFVIVGVLWLFAVKALSTRYEAALARLNASKKAA
jgi:AAA family ATP:ADP antiporter